VIKRRKIKAAKEGPLTMGFIISILIQLMMNVPKESITNLDSLIITIK
jgi:hypothetical protein